MASNRFGNIFTFTTWGESHGECIGCVIDGCPAGLELTQDEIYEKLKARSPGRSNLVSARKEKDIPKIVSGVFNGKTTGTPICVIIENLDHNSTHYEPLQSVLRPGHANFTYLAKYGIFDHRGGGRSSARETACRVIAGAIAEKFLRHFGIKIVAYVTQVAGCSSIAFENTFDEIEQLAGESAVFCPNKEQEIKIMQAIDKAKHEHDSLGGVVECQVVGVPPGLGDPIYDKMESRLASAMMSIPASKAFEIGSGFNSAVMTGSQHNDIFIRKEGVIKTQTNYAGGVLGGITTGMPLIFRTYFKPASSIAREQKTCDLQGNETELCLPEGSRHDPTVVVRAVPVVRAMCACVLMDAFLASCVSRIDTIESIKIQRAH